MARTSNVFARVEPEIKEQAEEILDQLGIPMSNAVGMFLRQAQLGYTLPKSLMQKFYIEKLRFYVSGENLFTITGYDGIDPEFSRASVLNTGVDKLIYPFTRSFTVGAQLTF